MKETMNETQTAPEPAVWQHLYPLALGMMALPFWCLLVAVFGFIIWIPMTKYHFLVAFALTLGTIAWGCQWERKKSIVQGIIFTAITLLGGGYTSLFFEKGHWADGLGYHKPPVIEMKNGWNPLWEYNSARDQGYEDPWDLSVDRWWYWSKHYSKSDWYINAVFYAFSGNLDLGHLSRVFYLLATFIVVFVAIASIFRLPNYQSFFLAFVAALNPFSIVHCFSSYLDGALGSCLTLLFFALAAYLKSKDKRFLPFVIASIVIATNLKFTGVVYVAVFLIFFLIPYTVLGIHARLSLESNKESSGNELSFRRKPESRRVTRSLSFWIPARARMTKCGSIFSGESPKKILDRPLTYSLVLATVLALIAGVNPYLHHLYHHYTPFYPLHTVRKIDMPDRQNFMEDWTECNVGDANKLQQFFFYYLNTSDYHPTTYHHWEGKQYGVHTITVNKIPFGRYNTGEHDNHIFSHGDSNFGSLFMVSMWFSLLMMPFIRCKGFWFLFLAVGASIGVQPYIWYIRYIPHLWLIPIVVACSLLSQFNEVSEYRRRFMVIVGAVLFCMFVSATPFFAFITPEIKATGNGTIAYFMQRYPDMLLFDMGDSGGHPLFEYSTKTYISDVLPDYSFEQPDTMNDKVAEPTATDYESFLRHALSQEFDEPRMRPLGLFLQVCPVYLVANNQREFDRLSSVEDPTYTEMLKAILHLRWQQFKRAWT